MSPAFLSLYPKDSEPREISQREIYSQVSAITAYRVIAFCSANGGSGARNPRNSE